ncbi:tetratricopeptide repeat protein [Brachyspira pilosicoli]|uniref:tetratricopeptide repeat protein n=1 Tax=Brachyspira pilosicoli TaxID=52584 RepID=UPI0012F6484B|nr:tetratricopeptide repeat protein [Brachyspira pilosicoli]
MKDREIKSTIITLFLVSIFLFALIYFIHTKNIENRFDKTLENYTTHLQSITTNNIVINLDTKILESSMAEIMKNSNDLLNFWFAFLSVIMIVFTFASIFINNNILSESKENLEYIENLKKEMEEFKYEAKKLIFDMDIETQKKINEQQNNINQFLKDIDKQYKETLYYIDKEKIHINDTMNSIKNELGKLKLENEKAFDNINKIKDEYRNSIDKLKIEFDESIKSIQEKSNQMILDIKEQAQTENEQLIESIKKQAEEETKKLIEENNRNIEISNLFNSAYQAYDNKNYNLCIDYYNQIIKITDDLLKGYDKNSEEYSKYKNICSIAYNNRGTAKKDLCRYKESIDDYDKAIELNNNYSEAYNNRGVSKSNLGNNKEAIDDYNKAIELNPNYSEAYNNRGVSKSNLGNDKEAIKDFDKAIELDSNNADIYNNRGEAKNNLKQYKEATKDFYKAIELNPNDSYYYYNIGNTKYNLKQYNEAIKDYNKAIELNPNYAQAYLNRVLPKQLLANNTKDENEKNKLIEEAYNDFIEGYKLADDKLKEEYKQKAIIFAKQGYKAIIKICDKMGWEY